MHYISSAVSVCNNILYTGFWCSPSKGVLWDRLACGTMDSNNRRNIWTVCQVCRLEWNKYHKFVYAIMKYFDISTIAIYYSVDFLFETECIQIMRLSLKPRDSKVTNTDNESFTLFQVDSKQWWGITIMWRNQNLLDSCKYYSGFIRFWKPTGCNWEF